MDDHQSNNRDDAPPFLEGLVRHEERAPAKDEFPGCLPWLTDDFQLMLPGRVTFFVGENGSGKSTLLEAAAALSGLPVSGGSRYEMDAGHGPEAESPLATYLRPRFIRRPRDGYFFRAEFYAHFASLLDRRAEDPWFRGNPYKSYGGRPLHTMSHGESFLSLMQNRFTSGLFLMDEPESALSPQRQLTLLSMMHDRVEQHGSQFLIATHSPVMLTYPNARIISFDGPRLKNITLEETSHYQITRGILERPGSYWKHLVPESCQDDS